MAGQFRMDESYIDVAARIKQFRDLYPTGSMQPFNPDRPFEVITIGDRSFVVCVEAAFRTPDDLRPGVGTAWEPFPGKTPYTKDSELMNAQTSAWGRAIVAVLAADTRKGIASAEEVRNRQEEELPQPRPVPSNAAEIVTQEAAKAGYAGDDFDIYIATTYPNRTVHELTPEELTAELVFFREMAKKRELNNAVMG